MRVAEINVYKFSELEKSVQEYVIEKYYENEDYPFLSSDLEESLKLNENNIFEDGFEINYSLGYSQGDGLCVIGDIDIKKIFNLLTPELQETLKDKVYRLYSTGNTGRYAYCSADQIGYELDLTDEDDYDKMHELLAKEVLPIVQNIYVVLCKELEKHGYSILEYRMSTEEFSEYSDMNDYEYYETGRMF